MAKCIFLRYWNQVAPRSTFLRKYSSFSRLLDFEAVYFQQHQNFIKNLCNNIVDKFYVLRYRGFPTLYTIYKRSGFAPSCQNTILHTHLFSGSFRNWMPNKEPIGTSALFRNFERDREIVLCDVGRDGRHLLCVSCKNTEGSF